MDLLCRNGFYPYAWIDDIEKLDFEGIPPPEALHSSENYSVLYDNDDDGDEDIERKYVTSHHQRKSRALPKSSRCFAML